MNLTTSMDVSDEADHIDAAAAAEQEGDEVHSSAADVAIADLQGAQEVRSLCPPPLEWARTNQRPSRGCIVSQKLAEMLDIACQIMELHASVTPEAVEASHALGLRFALLLRVRGAGFVC